MGEMNLSRNLVRNPPEGLSEHCEAVGKCEMCTSSDLWDSPICKETGRRQKFLCSANDGKSKEVAKPSYQSCKRTEVDEEFGMVNEAMFACFYASSVFMVYSYRRQPPCDRKQKRLNASLFDQRRRGMQSQGRTESENGEGAVELSRIVEEQVPLIPTTSRSQNLEVI
eukprot:scaffold350_cov133-Cylindrotheca_fusiformis.AAC.10